MPIFQWKKSTDEIQKEISNGIKSIGLNEVNKRDRVLPNY